MTTTDNAAATSAIFGRRYELHESLGHGSMGTVYRAIDRLSLKDIALKRLMASADDLLFASQGMSTDSALSLAREFQTLASLHHPYVISVQDYGFDQERQPYFTMDLLEGAQTILDAGRSRDNEGKIELLVQMVQALAYIHRRGIWHRDLKPGNVLVARSGQVKVLDFGLSVRPGEDPQAAGTLAYMAPEVLEGEAADASADLYAVGVIAFQLLTGNHPFNTYNITAMVEQIIMVDPDYSLIADERLRGIVARLMAKKPADRYSDADAIINAFAAALGKPIALETEATRESFLQAARLVGRDDELAKLSDVLVQAAEGHGSAWLIGGESGVGKSRLLDELRTQALVRGFLVLRGQARSEGGSLYQIWREALRWLSLFSDLSDFEASVLKLLVPDIATLIGREVPDAPMVEAVAMQKRLFGVVQSVLERQQAPILIILEDLHWASESLDLLQAIVAAISNQCIMIVASYRDDERPELPAILKDMQLLKLQRLSEQHISELSVSMLGDGGRRPDLIKLLQTETEGNVFFLVEIVRALAEEMGELSNIAFATLPQQVIAGGVQQIIIRRLHRVLPADRPLLEAAAVAGRQLDLALLKLLDPAVDIERWLTNCANAAVLDIQDEHWRFAHDKLRERLLDEIEVDRRRDLHRQVATGIEQITPDDERPAVTLAYHWSVAGDIAKQLHYTARAGLHALDNGANQEAASLLSKALDLHGQLYPNAATRDQRFQRARWEQALGRAYVGVNDLTAARTHLEAALTLLDAEWPASRGKLTRGLLAEVGRQMLHLALRNRYIGRSKDPERALELVRVYEPLGEILYFSGDQVATLYALISKLNLAESAPPSIELAGAYGTAGVAAGLIPLHGLSRFYGKQALASIRALSDPSALAYTLILAGILEISAGNWQKAEELMDECSKVGRELGNQRLLIRNRAMQVAQHRFKGEYSHSEPLTDELLTWSQRDQDVQGQIWALEGIAETTLRLHEADAMPDVLQRMKSARTLLGSQPDLAQEIIIDGAAAFAHLRKGENHDAFIHAGQGLANMSKYSPTLYYIFVGYAHITLTLLTLWENGNGLEDEKSKLPAMARQSALLLSKLRSRFAIAQPFSYVCDGLYESLNGKPEQALKTWQRAQKIAAAMTMPYEEGLAHYYLARSLPAGDAARREHIEQACTLFAQVKAPYDLKQAEALR